MVRLNVKASGVVVHSGFLDSLQGAKTVPFVLVEWFRYPYLQTIYDAPGYQRKGLSDKPQQSRTLGRVFQGEFTCCRWPNRHGQWPESALFPPNGFVCIIYGSSANRP